MTLAPRLPHLLLGSMLVGLAASSGPARAEGDTPIPPSLTTPDQVGTSIGTLKFRDGIPDAATAAKIYDQLDFQRGVSAFLNGLRGVSIYAARQGIRDAGVKDNAGVLIFTGFARLVRRSLVPLGDRFRRAGPGPRHGRQISPAAAGL